MSTEVNDAGLAVRIPDCHPGRDAGGVLGSSDDALLDAEKETCAAPPRRLGAGLARRILGLFHRYRAGHGGGLCALLLVAGKPDGRHRLYLRRRLLRLLGGVQSPAAAREARPVLLAAPPGASPAPLRPHVASQLRHLARPLG